MDFIEIVIFRKHFSQSWFNKHVLFNMFLFKYFDLFYLFNQFSAKKVPKTLLFSIFLLFRMQFLIPYGMNFIIRKNQGNICWSVSKRQFTEIGWNLQKIKTLLHCLEFQRLEHRQTTPRLINLASLNVELCKFDESKFCFEKVLLLSISL